MAFAVRSEERGFSPEDDQLLETLAEAVVRRGMAEPAILFLESVGPMNFLGSQAMHFFSPLLDLVSSAKEYERLAILLERRETIPQLISRIEGKIQPRQAVG